MTKKIVAILFLTFSSGFILPIQALDDNGHRCSDAWYTSLAARSCGIYLQDTVGYMGKDGFACKLKASCKGKNFLGREKSYTTRAEPYLKDVKRLVNCNGSLEYDHC